MEIAVRDYRDDDYKACRALYGELSQHYAGIYEDPTIAGDDPGRGFDVFMRRADRCGAWIAKADAKVVGFAGLLVSTEEEGVGEIEPVIVSYAYRRKGIGTELIQHIIQEAIKRNIRFLSIRPAARNKNALSLFVRLGFNLVGHIDLFQDLSPTSDRKWKAGIVIHGHKLDY